MTDITDIMDTTKGDCGQQAQEPLVLTGQHSNGLRLVFLRRQGSAFTWSAVAPERDIEHAIDEAHRLGSYDHTLDDLRGVLEDLDRYLYHDDVAAFDRAYSVIGSIVGVAVPAPELS